ncbi:MAG: glycosyltransferase [Candidatus Pacearchaeota archaeon]
MKVAIFHDYLNQYGGAERVLEVFFEMFPEADLYTLFYDREKLGGLFEKNLKKTSFLDLSLVKRKHRYFIPFFPLACTLMKVKEQYDLVISSSAGYAKGFSFKDESKKPYHLSYCHTPLRYAWESFYLKDSIFKPKFLLDFFYFYFVNKLRKWDKKAADRVNFFIANSSYIASKIEKVYQRNAVVVYPPVDNNIFYPENLKRENFYLMVGRMLYYKKFDLAIQAFNVLKKPLKIVGTGPDYKNFKKIAKSSLIEFLGEVTDEQLRKLYSQAKGFIFPQVEDFGLVLAEAQSCGLPAIAFGYGGAQDIIEDKRTGLFFYQQNVFELIQKIKIFEKMDFDNNYIALRARKLFSKERFKKRIIEILKNLGFLLNNNNL